MRFISNTLHFLTILYILTFKISAVKCRHDVEVNWSRYRDTGVTDPALLIINIHENITSQIFGGFPNNILLIVGTSRLQIFHVG